MIESLVGFAVLLFLVFLRVPIALAMAIVGYVGFGYFVNFVAAGKLVATMAYEVGLNYELTVVPLFVLMGNFVSRAGLSEELYTASNSFLGHRKGGLAMATIVACGGFSAVCGSSLATAATMSKVTMPSMRKFGYSDSLAAGAIASGGTLGILIPPSVILVIYGVMTQSNIGKLFIAGVIPGLLGILLYMAAVRFTVWRKPESGPPADRANWQQRLKALRATWAVVALFVLIIGGIYQGVFSATEAAGVGATGALVISVLRRKLSLRDFFDVLVETIETTAMLFFVLLGAMIFSNFINYADLPKIVTDWVLGMTVSPFLVMTIIVIVYLLLGCVLESLSMILLTVPVFYPVILGLDFGMTPETTLIWFGIVVVVVTEISLITPPIGLNVFVLKTMLPDIPTGRIFAGVTPFWVADIVRLTLLIAIPGLAVYLPVLMG
jgi:tripartite ATP-independent transporter DctM subunit